MQSRGDAPWRTILVVTVTLWSGLGLWGCANDAPQDDHGMIECEGAWVDPESDERHCGGCDYACLPGQRCASRRCVLSCPQNQEECHGECFDLQTSEVHCGDCDRPCNPAERCVAGQCVCPDGLESCGGSCVDTNVRADHCGRCGQACGEQQFCANSTCYDPDVYGDGLVVVRRGFPGQEYAEQLAAARGWRFLAVETSDVTAIQSQIAVHYEQETFRYLLLIGTAAELPLARQYADGPYADVFETDPSLYADVDGDGFIELSVGRVPFSTPEELRQYFHDLAPKGTNYYFEHYPFADNDPMDENTVRNYTYYHCLSGDVPAIQVSRNTEFLDLRQRYLEATLLQLNTHGADASFWINGHASFSIHSLCPGCTLPGSCFCDTPEPLANRPVLIHATCNNAKELGVDLLRNGASAFMGFYNPSGYLSHGFVQRILSGTSVGDSFRQVYNHTKAISAAANLEGLNVVELDPQQSKDPYGFMLYGDPAVRLPHPPTFTPSVTFEKHDGKLVFQAEPPTQYPLAGDESLLCYTGSAVYADLVVSSVWWGPGTDFGAAHFVFYSVSAEDAATLLSTSGYSGGVEVELDAGMYKTYRVNLVTGIDTAVLLVLLGNPALSVDETFRLEIQYQ